MSDDNVVQANSNTQPENNPDVPKSKARIIVGPENNFEGAKISFGTITDGDIVTGNRRIINPSSDQDSSDS